MRRRNAFTLIELLVVVAIIAVLAAILFPVMAAAKGSAKRTTAMSNLKEIGNAEHLYLVDSDDHLPFRFPVEPEWKGYGIILFAAGGGPDGPQGYDDLYRPYLKNDQVWFSPEDRLPQKGYTSFTFNEQLAFDWALSSIPRPAEAIYVTDRTDVYMATPKGPVDTYVWWEFTDSMPFAEASLPGTIDPLVVASELDPIRYVGNKALYLFLDGHAASLSFERTWGDASHNLHLATKS